MHWCFAYMCVSMRVWGPLEMKLGTAFIYHMGVGIEPRSSGRAAPNHWNITRNQDTLKKKWRREREAKKQRGKILFPVQADLKHSM